MTPKLIRQSIDARVLVEGYRNLVSLAVIAHVQLAYDVDGVLLQSGQAQHYLSLSLSGGVGVPHRFRNQLGQLRMGGRSTQRHRQEQEGGSPQNVVRLGGRIIMFGR